MTHTLAWTLLGCLWILTLGALVWARWWISADVDHADVCTTPSGQPSSGSVPATSGGRRCN